MRLTLLLLLLTAPVAAAPAVVSVENCGLLFTDNRAGVTGTDAGYSIPLREKSLWLFGDVFLRDPASPEQGSRGFVSNCGLLVKAGQGSVPLRDYQFFTDAKSGLARPLLLPVDDEMGDDKLRFWPMGGWFDAVSQRVYLYYARVRVTGGGIFGFKLEGYGLAVADASVPEKIAFTRLKSAEKLLWWPDTAGASVFGAAVVDGRDGFLYVTGVQERDKRKFGKMARVAKEKIADLAAYEYFAGGELPRWSKNLADAADVAGLTDFPSELSVSYNRFLGGYLAVHSIGVFEKARLSLAEKPWGPYRAIGEIGTPHRAFAKSVCYAGKEHPELAESGGRVVYVTYVDSDRYWLQLLKVTLGKDGVK